MKANKIQKLSSFENKTEIQSDVVYHQTTIGHLQKKTAKGEQLTSDVTILQSAFSLQMTAKKLLCLFSSDFAVHKLVNQPNFTSSV